MYLPLPLFLLLRVFSRALLSVVSWPRLTSAGPSTKREQLRSCFELASGRPRDAFEKPFIRRTGQVTRVSRVTAAVMQLPLSRVQGVAAGLLDFLPPGSIHRSKVEEMHEQLVAKLTDGSTE